MGGGRFLRIPVYRKILYIKRHLPKYLFAPTLIVRWRCEASQRASLDEHKASSRTQPCCSCECNSWMRTISVGVGNACFPLTWLLSLDTFPTCLKTRSGCSIKKRVRKGVCTLNHKSQHLFALPLLDASHLENYATGHKIFKERRTPADGRKCTEFIHRRFKRESQASEIRFGTQETSPVGHNLHRKRWFRFQWDPGRCAAVPGREPPLVPIRGR